MTDVAPKTICVRCKQPCELGDLVYVMVSAAINDPNSFLGVTEIGASGPNGVVHQSCFHIEVPTSDGTFPPPEEFEDEPVTQQAIQRTPTLDGFNLG
jgi:hypothetical protein